MQAWMRRYLKWDVANRRLYRMQNSETASSAEISKAQKRVNKLRRVAERSFAKWKASKQYLAKNPRLRRDLKSRWRRLVYKYGGSIRRSWKASHKKKKYGVKGAKKRYRRSRR